MAKKALKQTHQSTASLLHDLVNPLTTVSLNLNRLKEEGKINSNLLERAIRGTQALEKFIEEARLQIRNQEPKHRFSVKTEIRQAIKMVDHKANVSGISIVFQKQKNIYLYGNSIKFNHLITNLLSNAIDAYEGVTNVKKIVEVTLDSDSKNATITIHDNGIGIKAHYLPYIFEPLFTTKPRYKGTGMGLYLCKKIVENSFKGKIKAQSRKNSGTDFIIQIPIC